MTSTTDYRSTSVRVGPLTVRDNETRGASGLVERLTLSGFVLTKDDSAALMMRGRTRLLRFISWALVVVFLVLLLDELRGWVVSGDRSIVAIDYRLYMDATSRWLAGGGYFDPHQLAGPYTITPGDVLYPPNILPLFIIFTQLPAFLWWGIPLAGTVALVAWHRPSPAALVGIAMCLWFPATVGKVIAGNPVLWAVLAVAAATHWGWPGALALIKPSLAPFAMVGMRRRSWWVTAISMAAVSLLLLPLWADWIRVMLNGHAEGGLLYSVQEVPMMAIPLLAWLGGREPPGWTRRSPT